MSRTAKLLLAFFSCFITQGVSRADEELTLPDMLGPKEEAGIAEKSDTLPPFGAELFEITDYIDSFFGDTRTEEQRQGDWYRIGGAMNWRSGDGVDFDQRIRAAVNLDALSDRLKLVIQGIDEPEGAEDQEQRDSEAGDLLPRTRAGSGEIGLRYDLYRKGPSRVALDSGLRFSSGANPFTQLWGSTRFRLGEEWLMHPAQYFFLEADEGAGTRTRLDLDRKLGPDSFIRLRTEPLWSEEQNGGQLLEEVSLFKRLSTTSIGSLSAMAFSDPLFTADYYRLSCSIRRLIWRSWLFVEVEPALRFPDDQNYHTTPEITFRIDIFYSRPDTSKNAG